MESPGQQPGANSESELVGQQLGNWRIVRLLAKGGFGVVYEARHISIEGHRAAIKVLHRSLAADPEVQRRFTSEANAASRIAHPNIVQIFDAGTTPDGACYIVMAFLDGKPLSALLEKGPLAPARAAALVSQVASALAAAHDLGIIHRDLKPDNIVVLPSPGASEGEGEQVKVLDFGIAKLAGETGHTQTGTLLGTPYYMSPEQWQGDKKLDGRADIYSLGIILYECLTGERPFSGTTALQCMYAHVQKPMPDPGERVALPDELRQLVLRMASKAPEERPASMREIETQLRSLVSSPDALLRSTARTRFTKRLSLRALRALRGLPERRSLLLRLAALSALLLIGGLWLAFGRRASVAKPAVGHPPVATPSPPDMAAPSVPAELVVLGPSRFPIGTGPATALDGPAHTVEIGRFAIGRTEVSFASLAEYEAATGRRLVALQGINLAKFGTRPAVNLTRDEAADYCRWRYARWGGRLPTETEWEFAARSGDSNRLLPWAGPSIEPALANLGAARPRTFPVESFESGASAQGLLHLIGNAAEWTASDAAPYPGSSARPTPVKKQGQALALAVVRGGGANTPAAGVRATSRWFVAPSAGNPFLGFRCAADP